jgi:flagellar basal-body rod protein FlgB
MAMTELTNAGAIPALEMAIRFAGQRQRIIANNIANITTPDFQNQDVSVSGFQQMMQEAIEKRRAKTGGQSGELEWEPTRELAARGPKRELTLMPTLQGGGILRHDHNNADVEKLMRDNVENVSYFRVAVDLLRSRYQMMQSAMSERVA